ncbi:MAG: glycosyltransferase, partial [Lachnospiraceae bacterium]|nr:glycosyltransferase [Lachnospiraceae bacterium]
MREQLLSICNQTRKPDEIIICDDNSSDMTSAIIKSFMDETQIPIYYFENVERMGYAENFKKALALAQGDIIFFSDQDDIWEKEKIEVCADFFDKYASALALSTSYCLIDGNGNYKKENFFYNFHSVKKIRKIEWKAFIKHPKYPGMAMAVRRKLIDRVVLTDDSREIPHDWLFNEAASYHGGMYFLNVNLTRYRIHENNT